MKKFPMESEELKLQIRTVRTKTLATLNSLTIQNAPPEKLIELRNSFDEKLDKLNDILEANNYQASQKDCEDLLNTLYSKIQEKVNMSEYKDFRQFTEDFELLKKVYRENAHGPAKDEVSERVGSAKMISATDQFVFLVKADFDKELMEAKQKLMVA